MTAPARLAGQGTLVHEPINQDMEARNAWLWERSRRRAMRAPQLAFGNAVSSVDGMMTADDVDMLNGSPSRFDWALSGPVQMIVPYANDRLADIEANWEPLFQPGHIAPEFTRFELRSSLCTDRDT